MHDMVLLGNPRPMMMMLALVVCTAVVVCTAICKNGKGRASSGSMVWRLHPEDNGHGRENGVVDEDVYMHVDVTVDVMVDEDQHPFPEQLGGRSRWSEEVHRQCSQWYGV